MYVRCMYNITTSADHPKFKLHDRNSQMKRQSLDDRGYNAIVEEECRKVKSVGWLCSRKSGVDQCSGTYPISNQNAMLAMRLSL